MHKKPVPTSILLFTLLLALGTVVAADGNGQLEPIPASEWGPANAAHLLRRAGFGPTPEEISRLAALSPQEAVSALVDYEKWPGEPPLALDPTSTDPRIDAKVLERIEVHRKRIARDIERRRARNPQSPENAPRQVATLLQRQAENRAIGEVGRTLHRQWLFQLRTWWLARMIQTRRPLEEKMTLFWHGHFTTSFDVVGNARTIQQQHDLFRREATGNFGRLLRQIAHDPAMLRYLDGNRNQKAKPNENFARELLELFALGEGHYTETDVTEAARAFSGWTYRDDRFFDNRRQHDYGTKTFLGQTGHFRGNDILRILLESPHAALFLSRKLAHFFLGVEPSPALTEGLAQTLRNSDYEIKPVLRQLFLSRAFYHPAVVGKVVKSPTELIVGLIRQLGLPVGESCYLGGTLMERTGQSLFRPPTVKGWPTGRAWINTSTLFVRQNILSELFRQGRRLVSDPKLAGVREKHLPRTHRASWSFTWDEAGSLRLPLLKSLKGQRTPEALLSHLETRFLAVKLPPESRIPLLQILGPNKTPFDPRTEATRKRILAAILLLTSSPEYQLQ